VCSSLSRRFCLPWLLLAPNQPLKRGKFISPGYNLRGAPKTLSRNPSFSPWHAMSTLKQWTAIAFAVALSLTSCQNQAPGVFPWALNLCHESPICDAIAIFAASPEVEAAAAHVGRGVDGAEDGAEGHERPVLVLPDAPVDDVALR